MHLLFICLACDRDLTLLQTCSGTYQDETDAAVACAAYIQALSAAYNGNMATICHHTLGGDRCRT